MKSTRDKILHTLLRQSQSTISDLAESVGINAISVRHHLTSLQAEGLVLSEEQRHGVGRPRLVYFLSEKGVEKFPTQYLRLTNRILDQLKSTLPSLTLNSIFSDMAIKTAGDLVNKGKNLSLEDKLDLLTSSLVEEGYSFNWQKQGGKYLIHEVNCPYLHISQSHPEVCLFDQTYISTVLSVQLKKIKCQLNGDTGCTYVIQNEEQA